MAEKLSPQEKEAAVKSITKAIGYAENGGKPDLNNLRAGKTGELKSIFQYEPATWKAYAKEYLGNEKAPLTPDNETTVTMKKVGDLIDKGYTAKQIASVWNSGDKDAYTGKFSNGSPSVGINKKYGVKFDVPSYADKVNNYAKEFYIQEQPQQMAKPQIQQQPVLPQQQPAKVNQSALGTLGGSSLKSGLLPSLADKPA